MLLHQRHYALVLRLDRRDRLTIVEEGLSNPEIAARLLLSRRTVATHVSHILKKLDVHSRTDIARARTRSADRPSTAVGRPGPRSGPGRGPCALSGCSSRA